MTHPEIVDLRQFYETALGRTARRMIRRQLRRLWPQVAKFSMLGLGYATPYLRPFLDDGAATFAAMPPEQGVSYWPEAGPDLVTLADESELPFADCSFDRIILVHGMEALEQRRSALREIWRVLAPNGRLIVVAPNRRGIWARTEMTPFGHGNPYSISQLNQVLRDSLFVPERSVRCLYFPPVRSGFFLVSAAAWESLGERWWPKFSGAIIVEASKQVYALPTERSSVRRRLAFPALLQKTSSSER